MRSPHSTSNTPANDREAVIAARIMRSPQVDRLEASARIAQRKMADLLKKPGMSFKDDVQFCVTLLGEALQAMEGKR